MLRDLCVVYSQMYGKQNSMCDFTVGHRVDRRHDCQFITIATGVPIAPVCPLARQFANLPCQFITIATGVPMHNYKSQR